MSEPALRILHISDLHERVSEVDGWRRDRVLGAEWSRNLDEILQHGPIDFVCLTGDIAFSGRREEYEKATLFVVETLRLAGLAPASLLVVPGNHDVNRDIHQDAYAAVRTRVRAGFGETSLSRFLAGGAPNPLTDLDPVWIDLLLERQVAYRRWITDLGLTDLAPSRSAHGRLGFAVRRARRDGGTVEFVGLNTAWLSGWHDHRDLVVTEDQAAMLLRQPADPDTLRVVLMHHAFNDLLDGRKIQELLAGRVDIVLRGHLHRTESSHFLLDQGRGFAEFAVGSLFDSEELDRYPNGCQVVTIDTQERPLAGRNWFRSWSDSSGGFWHDDNSLYARTANGRLAWVLAGGDQAATIRAGGAALTPHPFADYLRALRRHASREGGSAGLMRPDRVYVPQRARQLTAAADPDTNAEESDELLHELMRSVWSGDRRRLMIFGNYGMGKTYFALRTVIEQVDTFTDPSARRLPVYFPLRRLDCEAALTKNLVMRRDVIDQIGDHLRTLDFPRLSRDELASLIARGGAAVILDGLDELQTRSSDWETLLRPITDLPGALCVVTSRTAYVEHKDCLLSDWDLYELQEWRPDREWHDYVMSCRGEIEDVEAFIQSVASRPRLRMLTTRPLWCFMIVTVRDRVSVATDVGEADLYHHFIEEALERVMRDKRPDSILSPRRRFGALECFARRCAEEDRLSLSRDTFRDLLNRFLDDLNLSVIDGFLDRELRVYSFLNVDRGGSYSFGHASFGSYFIAAAAARDLLPRIAGLAPLDAVDLRDTWTARTELDDEQRVFLAGILRSPEATTTFGFLPPESPHGEALAKLDGFVRAWLAKSTTPGTLRRNLFLTLVLVSRYSTEGRPRLKDLKLKGAQLPGLDLSDCDLDGLDFTMARLQRAKFLRSSLRRCRFTGAAIDGADFSDAVLFETDLGRSQPPVVAPIIDSVSDLS